MRRHDKSLVMSYRLAETRRSRAWRNNIGLRDAKLDSMDYYVFVCFFQFHFYTQA